MVLSKSVHFTVACFIQCCILWFPLEVEVTGARFVLEQAFVLSRGCFSILSQAP